MKEKERSLREILRKCKKWVKKWFGSDMQRKKRLRKVSGKEEKREDMVETVHERKQRKD